MQQHTPTVLVVEDEKSLLKAWAEIFRREGLNVLTAADGANALNLALRWHPDLLVVDLVMPNSDGLTLIKRLRENKWGQTVPVMFLSSWLGSGLPDPKDSKEEPLRDFYLHEDWNFEQVVLEVREKLKPSKLRQMAA